MSFSTFICSTSLADADMIRRGGKPALEQFDVLQAAVVDTAGVAAGNIFCEPTISHGNGAAATTLSWYGAYEGEAVPLASLSGAERAAAERLLQARIEALRPVIAHSPDGDLVASALYVQSADDVFVVQGEPVLTNWATVPKGSLVGEERMRAAFANGLGQFGVQMSAPPTDPVTFQSWRRTILTGAAATGAAALATTAAAGGSGSDRLADGATTGAAASAISVAQRMPWYRSAWAPALLATLIAAILLIILLIPGVLLAPDAPRVALIEEQAQRLRESNDALAERLRQLQEAQQAEIICTPEGDLLLPGIDDARDGDSKRGDAKGGPRGDDTAAVPPLQPPAIDDLEPPVGSSASSLLGLLDSSTVLVLAQSPAGVGVGTGFFINNQTVVTNDHVVAPGVNGRVFVTSPALGRIIPVRILARTSAVNPGDIDFAILRGDFPDTATPLVVSSTVGRLDHVVAAGYPAIVTGDDARFQELIETGNVSDGPLLSTTRGVVTSIQSNASGVGVIAHDADISAGNSGGPLTDLCGRAVGVNTFRAFDSATGATARYSLQIEELRAFLDANGVSYTASASACQPRRVASEPDATVATEPAVDDPAEPAALETDLGAVTE